MAHDPAPADRALLAVLDRDAAAVSRRAGAWLACGPGCSECCRVPFPITRLDAWRLRRGLARADAGRRSRITARAHRVLAALREGFPGNVRTGRLVHSEAALDRFFDRHRDLPCPVLDPEQGTCELYEDRPLACRIHGPPLRFGDERVAPCRHCFENAPGATVEASRWEPDPEEREREILTRMGVAPEESWETLVPYAVRGAVPAAGAER
jgi:Fe-S-cluster containining protein